MAGVSVKIPPSLERSALVRALQGGIQDGLNQAGQRLERAFKKSVREKVKGRSGSTMRSVGYLAKPLSLEVGWFKEGIDGEPPAWIAQLNFGGTITPKKAKMLAWPFPSRDNPILPASGNVSPFGTPGQAASAAHGFGDVATRTTTYLTSRQSGAPSRGTFIRPSKSGRTLVLFGKFQDGTATPLLLLADSVTQKGRHFFEPVEAQAPQIVSEELDRSVSAKLRGAA